MNLNEQLKLKISLEELFRKEIRVLFNRIKFEYRIGIITGSRIRAIKFRPQWEALLTNHYRRVQNAFRGIVKDNIKQNDDVDDLIIAALIAWAEKRGPESAAIITNTTQNNMNDAIMQTRQAFSDDGITDYSNRELAMAASVILSRKFLGREEGIISSETQAAAESTKLIEAYSVSGLNPITVVTGERVGKPEAEKEWVTMGDKDVRDIHKRVNGQKVNITEPFIVNGQKLMYPGDNSRGATVENTINCRCSSFYVFK